MLLTPKNPLQRRPSLLHTPPSSETSKHLKHSTSLTIQTIYIAGKEYGQTSQSTIQWYCPKGGYVVEAVRRTRRLAIGGWGFDERRRFEGLRGTNFGFLKLLHLSIEAVTRENHAAIAEANGGDYLTFRILHYKFRLHFAQTMRFCRR